jgi:hypothetical protein
MSQDKLEVMDNKYFNQNIVSELQQIRIRKQNNYEMSEKPTMSRSFVDHSKVAQRMKENY